MRKLLNWILLFCLFAPLSAFAILTIELTQGVTGAVPITIETLSYHGEGQLPQPVTSIISTDLQNSGHFKVYSARDSHVNYVVSGEIKALEKDRYQIAMRLLDSINPKTDDHVAMRKTLIVPAKDLRAAAHHLSDLIFKHITGIKGVFSTKIAYIVIQRNEDGSKRYLLEVADQDGYNPKPLLNSPEPIMSPAWAPNGRDIAYVSFENKRASIYVQNVINGTRQRLSEFPGINGAPAWSPDGKKLAVVLSKSGSPNIYVMDIASRHLRPLTRDFYINTEPSWAPDGKSLIFTSNRSGGAQIYRVSLNNGAITKVSYDGSYNARASYTWDGSHIAMIHRVNGVYSIAILDLDTGITRVLNSKTGDSASPSIAPNGTMILYDTVAAGRNVLGMVSADGRIQLILPDRLGDAQDPAWSPFLS